MTYNKYFKKNLTTISVCLAIFFLIFYLFSNYRHYNKTQFSYVENLTGSPEFKAFDYSSIKDPGGTTYYKCKTGDPDCKPGQICTRGIGCVGDGEDPFGKPGHIGNDVGCCPGTKPFINNWEGSDGKRYYKCCKVPFGKLINNCNDVKCPNGQVCDPTTGQCIHDNSGCVPPCDSGQVCQNGKCISSVIPNVKSRCNPPCDSGQVCQNGKCVASDSGGCSGTPKINPKPFPTSNDVFFAVQYRNSTNVPITVWLQGNQPPCSDTGPSCKFQETDVWTDVIKAKFSIIGNNNSVKKMSPSRNQILQPGEVWRIEPPLNKIGKPSWCYGDGNKNCPGTRAWFSRADVTGLHANNGYTGIEPNFNSSNSIDYDISGVDGLNANVTVEYTGDCGGVETYKKCLTKLDNCYSLTTKNGVRTCLSPSQISNSNPMAGCQTGSMDDPVQCKKKMDCHKWWAESTDGQKWLNFVQKNKCGECDAYGWAYDEMTYEDGDCPYTKNCDPGKPIGPCDYTSSRPTVKTRTNDSVNPNINCGAFPYKKGDYFNVDILKIL